MLLHLILNNSHFKLKSEIKLTMWDKLNAEILLVDIAYLSYIQNICNVGMLLVWWHAKQYQVEYWES